MFQTYVSEIVTLFPWMISLGREMWRTGSVYGINLEIFANIYFCEIGSNLPLMDFCVFELCKLVLSLKDNIGCFIFTKNIFMNFIDLQNC